MNYFDREIKNIKEQYPPYYKALIFHFEMNKRKYFIEGNYNYNLIPLDIRANSYLERYNKEIKDYLGEKKFYNWVVFLKVINNEIIRFKNILISNKNKNVRYYCKNSKFGTMKYTEKNIR